MSQRAPWLSQTGTRLRRAWQAWQATWRAAVRWTRARKARKVGLSVALAAVALLPILFWVVYPAVGAIVVRKRLIATLERKLGREVTLDSVDVRFGKLTVRKLRIAGDQATQPTPMATIDMVHVDFNGLASLVGNVDMHHVAIEGATLTLPNKEATELLLRLQGRSGSGVGANDRNETQRNARQRGLPRSIAINKLSVRVPLASQTGFDRDVAEIVVDKVAVDRRQRLIAASGLSGTVLAAGRPFDFAAGSVAVSPHSVHMVDGEVAGQLGQATHIRINLARHQGAMWGQMSGTYPSTSGGYWTLNLATDASRQQAVGNLLTFRNDSDQNPAALALTATSRDLRFSGAVALAGIVIDQKWLASQPVRELGAEIQTRGTVDFAHRKVELPLLRMQRGAAVMELAATASASPKQLTLRASIPTVPCQDMLAALPSDLVPELRGYELTGDFNLEFRAAIDWTNLDQAVLDSKGGLDQCRIAKAPAQSPEMLRKPFTVNVEVAPHKYEARLIGGKNKSFVHFDGIPDYMINSLVATEDPTFLNRDCFEAGSLARAIVENLKTGSFRVGGSTIPMQIAKNVFFSGERTVSRKLQELFFAWHMESILARHRMLEIYMNIIEFGPGIYGIENAAHHFFGKEMYELMPLEAAYFSAIVPRPRTAYANYCEGKLDAETKGRVKRALTLMVNKAYITSEDWDAATASELEFAPVRGTKQACMAKRQLALTSFDTR